MLERSNYLILVVLQMRQNEELVRILKSQTFSPLLRWLNFYNLAKSGVLEELIAKTN